VPQNGFAILANVRFPRRQLSKTQQKAYIDAVLCLSKKAARSGIAGTVHRYDDHVAVHNTQTPAIHFVVCSSYSVAPILTDCSQGHFTLWHRYFVATYEKALREECGYTGGQP
jgi:tyrosinase